MKEMAVQEEQLQPAATMKEMVVQEEQLQAAVTMKEIAVEEEAMKEAAVQVMTLLIEMEVMVGQQDEISCQFFLCRPARLGHLARLPSPARSRSMP